MNAADYHRAVLDLERPSPHGQAMHAALGAASEAGEVAGLFRKGETDPLDLLDEYADVLFYLVLGLDAAGFDISEAMAWNVMKLERRREHGKDKAAERLLLESIYGEK
jgi:NTP pyrophosphatase (non-canonical NTP hydrolase)